VTTDWAPEEAVPTKAIRNRLGFVTANSIGLLTLSAHLGAWSRLDLVTVANTEWSAFGLAYPIFCTGTAPKFHSGAIIECEAVLQEAFDWVQRSSVAADNNRIYAEDLVTKSTDALLRRFFSTLLKISKAKA
jgi:hypothetical protein